MPRARTGEEGWPDVLQSARAKTGWLQAAARIAIDPPHSSKGSRKQQKAPMAQSLLRMDFRQRSRMPRARTGEEGWPDALQSACAGAARIQAKKEVTSILRELAAPEAD